MNHVEPSADMSIQDREDFVHVAQFIDITERKLKVELTKRDEKPKKTKRLYDMWSPCDRYMLLIGIALFGDKKYKLITQLFKSRSDGQVLKNYFC